MTRNAKRAAWLVYDNTLLENELVGVYSSYAAAQAGIRRLKGRAVRKWRREQAEFVADGLQDKPLEEPSWCFTASFSRMDPR